jgi:cell division protein ZipA
MEDNFRNVLIILSTIVIGGIFVHGLWTIRKNKNPYKLKTKHERVEEAGRVNYDGAGFDMHGVSKVKVVPSDVSALDEDTRDFNNDRKQPEINLQEQQNGSMKTHQGSDEPDRDGIEPTLGNIAEIDNDEKATESHKSLDNSQNSYLYDEADRQQALKKEQALQVKNKSVYQTPITQEKPNVKKEKRETAKQALKRNQIEIDFDNANNKANNPSTEKKLQIEPEVLVLSVVMPENKLISGAALLPTLLTLGMKYGDMNIFHRHQDNAGNGKVTFSLANMVNPGTFDLDTMETFTTPGVTLFMTLPNTGSPFEVFEQMLSAAKQITQEFSGQLLDDKRSVMTKQTEQHYIGRVRDFDRKNRINSL